MSAVTSPARTSKLAPDSGLSWPYTFVLSRASNATLMEPLLIDCGLSQLAARNAAVTKRQCLARESPLMSPMSRPEIKTIHAACSPCSPPFIDHPRTLLTSVTCLLQDQPVCFREVARS